MSVRNIIYIKEPVATATPAVGLVLVGSLQLGPQKALAAGSRSWLGPASAFVVCFPCRWRSLEKGRPSALGRQFSRQLPAVAAFLPRSKACCGCPHFLGRLLSLCG